MSRTVIRRLPSSDGINTLYGKLYLPYKTPYKGIIQLVHGMVDHIDRYDGFMEYAAFLGYIACGNDHLGHGHTAKSGDLGYFADNDGWKLLINDVIAFGNSVRADYPSLPHFLLGHSMGSFIARLAALREDELLLAGLLLCGTGGPNAAAGAGLALCKTVSRLKGKRYVSKLIDNTAFGSYDAKSEKHLRFSWTTHDLQTVRNRQGNIYESFIFTSSAMEDLMHLTINCNAKEWAAGIRKSLPVYLFSGTEDPVGAYGRGVKKVADMLTNAGVQDVKLRMYAGDRHELLHELDRAAVYADVIDWTEAHI